MGIYLIESSGNCVTKNSVARNNHCKKMAQQEQIIINMAQVQNQDQKQHLLKLFPKKLLLTFSLLQLASGIVSMLSQVSSMFLLKNIHEIASLLSIFRSLVLELIRKPSPPMTMTTTITITTMATILTGIQIKITYFSPKPQLGFWWLLLCKYRQVHPK